MYALCAHTLETLFRVILVPTKEELDSTLKIGHLCEKCTEKSRCLGISLIPTREEKKWIQPKIGHLRWNTTEK